MVVTLSCRAQGLVPSDLVAAGALGEGEIEVNCKCIGGFQPSDLMKLNPHHRTAQRSSVICLIPDSASPGNRGQRDKSTLHSIGDQQVLHSRVSIFRETPFPFNPHRSLDSFPVESDLFSFFSTSRRKRLLSHPESLLGTFARQGLPYKPASILGSPILSAQLPLSPGGSCELGTQEE